MTMGSILKKAAVVYAAKKAVDTVRGSRQPEPRLSRGSKLGAVAAIALVGGAGVFLARSGRLPAVPDVIRKRTSLGFDSSSNGDAPLDESSKLADRPL
jgi:hypothetical protein